MARIPGILHIDTGREWRGGQQQAVYLYEGLLAREFKTNFICKKNSKLEKYFKGKSLPFVTLGLKNELDFKSAWQIARICVEKNYQILHLHTAHALSIGLLAKLFNKDVKTIGVRRVDFHIKKNPLSQIKYKTRKLDQLVCISKAIQNILLEDGVNKEKTKVIHSGIDIHKFDDIAPACYLRQELSIPEDHLLVGTVAALVDHKDYPTLLKAAQRVMNENKNVSFLAAGDGERENEIKELARHLDLQGRFHFLGYRNDIGGLLKILDVFVLASKEEGMGTSLLDAQAVGLPVIGTTAGGIPEIIENGKNGLVVPVQAPQKLAGAILTILEKEALRRKYGNNSLEFVKKFDIDITIEKNINLYQNLLKSGSS
jgi:glycosyltransferase involved in cell wall biosynthesis